MFSFAHFSEESRGESYAFSLPFLSSFRQELVFIPSSHPVLIPEVEPHRSCSYPSRARTHRFHRSPPSQCRLHHTLRIKLREAATHRRTGHLAPTGCSDADGEKGDRLLYCCQDNAHSHAVLMLAPTFIGPIPTMCLFLQVPSAPHRL